MYLFPKTNTPPCVIMLTSIKKPYTEFHFKFLYRYHPTSNFMASLCRTQYPAKMLIEYFNSITHNVLVLIILLHRLVSWVCILPFLFWEIENIYEFKFNLSLATFWRVKHKIERKKLKSGLKCFSPQFYQSRSLFADVSLTNLKFVLVHELKTLHPLLHAPLSTTLSLK